MKTSPPVFAVFLFFLLFCACANAAQTTININSENDLRSAIDQINTGSYSAYDQVTFSINVEIPLSSDLNELVVPSGTETTFTFAGSGGFINGDNKYQGFVVSATDQSTVEFSNLTISKCVAQGEAGEDGTKSGGGGGAGLGGAIYVKSGNVSLVDVKFQNNRAIGGAGGTYNADASTQFGSGGKNSLATASGGNGRNTTTATDEATFGGGGGGSANEDNAGTGGLGGGDGGTLIVDSQTVGTGGGGLAAGGAVFVESGATISVQYSNAFDSSTAFAYNSVTAGTAQGTAEAGNALGNALFAGGNVKFDTSTPEGGTKTVTFAKNQTVGGFAGSVDFQNVSQTELNEIKANSGDVSVVGGGTLLMQGENLSLGKTIVDGSTLVVENGKAISDYSEVQLANGGVLEVKSNETIGYLSGGASSEVHLFYTDGTTKTGGKTLTIAGDEYSSDYAGVNPGNGRTVLGDTITAFYGKIVTDHNQSTQETLLKTGTGLLILAGDNTNDYVVGDTVESDDFIVQLQGGTIQVNHNYALGGGVVNVKHSDTELDRNMFQAGAKSLEIANTFNVQSTNPFRIGVADELASETDVKLTLSGRITGNQNVMMNMGNKDQVLKLTNYSTVSSEANQISQIQLNQGTLALVGDLYGSLDGTTTWANSAGSAKIVALAGSDNHAQLRIDTLGLALSNEIAVESGALTITNGYDDGIANRVTQFTLAGTISGTGGLRIDLQEKTDVVVLSGYLNGKKLSYTGDTIIDSGILQYAYNESEQKSTTIQMSGGLQLGADGTLDLNGNTVAYTGQGTYDLNGTVIDSSTAQTGALAKLGTGTWNLNLQNSLGHLKVAEGAVVLQNANSVDSASILGSSTLKLATDVRLESVSGELEANLDVGEHQLTLAGKGETFYGKLIGGENAVIVVENGITDKESTPDWILYGSSSSSWTGTIEVLEGAHLRVASLGGLGKSLNSVDKDDVGKVVLDKSTLSINMYNGTASLGVLEISNSGGDGFGIVNTLSTTDTLHVYDVVGSGDMIKNGSGSLSFIGTNAGFSGDIQLNEGLIYIQDGAQTGSGRIVSDGDSEATRAVVVFAAEDATSRTLGSDLVFNEELILYYTDAADLVLTGDVSGTGTWDFMAGNGTIVLNGNYEQYSGEINMSSGMHLQLGSNLINATVTVGSNSMLEAGGTIHNLNVKSDGIVQIYSDSQLKITNALNLDSGSRISVECVGTANGGTERGSSIMIDGGTATINGGTIYLSATDIQIGDTFTFLTTTNDGDVVLNNHLTFTDNVNGARAVGSFDTETNTYTYTFLGFDYREGTDTEIRKIMGAYLNQVADSTIMTQEITEALEAIENHILANPDKGTSVYDQLVGQVYASMSGAQIHATTMLNQSLAAQLRPGARNGQMWDGTGSSYLGQAFSEAGLSGWMSAYGMFGEADDDGSAAGYDMDVYGGLIGLERCSYNMSRRLGFYYGYGQTKITANSALGKGTSDDNRLGLYLKWDDSLGYGIISGGVGFNSYKFNRSVLGESYGAKMDGIQSSFYAERGMAYQWGWGTLQPFLALQYAYQHQDSFSEDREKPLRLLGESVSTNSLRSMFGARFIKDFGTSHGQGASQIYLQGHWMHEYLDDKSEFTASIFTPTTFTINGNGHGSDWAVLGVGADWFATNQAQIFGSYDAQFNGESLFHIGTVGLRVVW